MKVTWAKIKPLNKFNLGNSILKSKNKIQMEVDGLLPLVEQEVLRAITLTTVAT
jgi:hypothetical protein